MRQEDDELGTLRRLTVRMLRAAAKGDDMHLARLRAERGACLDALALRGWAAATGDGGRRGRAGQQADPGAAAAERPAPEAGAGRASLTA